MFTDHVNLLAFITLLKGKKVGLRGRKGSLNAPATKINADGTPAGKLGKMVGKRLFAEPTLPEKAEMKVKAMMRAVGKKLKSTK